MHDLLYIRLTPKCNLDCSFCRAREYMQLADTGLEGFKQGLNLAGLYKPVVREVVWSGGEPLLASRKWSAARQVVKERYPGVREILVTNGYYVKRELFKELHEMSFIEVSIDGWSKERSERSMQALLEAGQYDLFEFIGESNRVNITSVITKDRLKDYRWHEDLRDLYTHLLPLGVQNLQLTFDENYPGPMSTDAMTNFVIGYDELQTYVKQLNRSTGSDARLSLKKFFLEECHACDEYVTVESDGSVTRDTPAPDVGVTGCNQIASVLGADAYRYIQSMINARNTYEREIEGKADVEVGGNNAPRGGAVPLNNRSIVAGMPKSDQFAASFVPESGATKNRDCGCGECGCGDAAAVPFIAQSDDCDTSAELTTHVETPFSSHSSFDSGSCD